MINKQWQKFRSELGFLYSLYPELFPSPSSSCSLTTLNLNGKFLSVCSDCKVWEVMGIQVWKGPAQQCRVQFTHRWKCRGFITPYLSQLVPLTPQTEA